MLVQYRTKCNCIYIDINPFLSNLIGTHITCKANGKGNKFVEGKNVQDCKFPFIHNGKQHISCAPSSDGKGPWCATKVDSKGNYVKDNWARCNKHCNIDNG